MGDLHASAKVIAPCAFRAESALGAISQRGSPPRPSLTVTSAVYLAIELALTLGRGAASLYGREHCLAPAALQ